MDEIRLAVAAGAVEWRQEAAMEREAAATTVTWRIDETATVEHQAIAAAARWRHEPAAVKDESVAAAGVDQTTLEIEAAATAATRVHEAAW
jgi:hypothetical protein